METVTESGEDLGAHVVGLDTPFLELRVRDSSERRAV
jgi:hypothetical protein